MDQQTIIAIVLVTLAVGGVLFAVLPYLTGEIKAEQRQEALKAPAAKKTAGVDRAKDGEARRKQVADSLKEIESRKTRKITLETKFQQAGLNWTRPKFYLISVAMCAGFTFFVYIVTKNIYLIGPAALIGLFGLPAWILSFLKKRRIVKFIDVFPNAIDVIVRGIKAGLPLGHCLQIIAAESPEPVRSEFRQILEAQTIGLTVAEAIERIVERVPVPEASFFSIVITIQQKAGGNLAEALGNLSRVLRERKKMKAKIQAMSSEAKSSAGIIGALPFIVSGLIYLTSPKYIMLLFTETTGHFVMACAAVWMFVGIMVMRKMINFDI